MDINQAKITPTETVAVKYTMPMTLNNAFTRRVQEAPFIANTEKNPIVKPRQSSFNLSNVCWWNKNLCLHFSLGQLSDMPPQSSADSCSPWQYLVSSVRRHAELNEPCSHRYLTFLGSVNMIYLRPKKKLLYWRNPTDPKIRPDPTFFCKKQKQTKKKWPTDPKKSKTCDFFV